MHELLTALVLTYNEEQNIDRALRALTWLPRVLLLDSFSTDATCEIAQGYPNVEIIRHAFDSHTEQWNFGLEQICTPWVLTLDADYELSPQIIAEIQALAPPDDISGYCARFEFRIFGRPLRASVYPPRTVLFRRERARYVSDGHTQLLQCEGKVVPLRGAIYHDDRKSLGRWIRSQDSYMRIEAAHLLSLPNPELKVQDKLRLKLIAPVVMLFYLLFGRGLILDGWKGWYYVCQRTIAELLLSLRLMTERNSLEDGKK